MLARCIELERPETTHAHKAPVFKQTFYNSNTHSFNFTFDGVGVEQTKAVKDNTCRVKLEYIMRAYKSQAGHPLCSKISLCSKSEEEAISLLNIKIREARVEKS